METVFCLEGVWSEIGVVVLLVWPKALTGVPSFATGDPRPAEMVPCLSGRRPADRGVVGLLILPEALIGVHVLKFVAWRATSLAIPLSLSVSATSSHDIRIVAILVASCTSAFGSLYDRDTYS
jgi:hypothetical protein